MTKSNIKPKAAYTMAYSGARTAKGGLAIGTSSLATGDITGRIKAVLVGDKVRYADGSEAVVTSGTGMAAMEEDRPYAIVGSHVSRGDHIVSTPAPGAELHIDEDNRPEGFLLPGYPHNQSLSA